MFHSFFFLPRTPYKVGFMRRYFFFRLWWCQIVTHGFLFTRNHNATEYYTNMFEMSEIVAMEHKCWERIVSTSKENQYQSNKPNQQVTSTLAKGLFTTYGLKIKPTSKTHALSLNAPDYDAWFCFQKVAWAQNITRVRKLKE